MPEMYVAGKLGKAGKRAFTTRGRSSAFSLTTSLILQDRRGFT